MHRDAAYGIDRDACRLPGEARLATPSDLYRAACEDWDDAVRLGEAARLPQRAGHRARADGDDRPPDGLRHDRHRAGLRAREVQEARRRRLLQDRQPVGAACAAAPRLQRARSAGDRRVRQRARTRFSPRRTSTAVRSRRRASPTRTSRRSRRPSPASSISRARSRRGSSARRHTSGSGLSRSAEREGAFSLARAPRLHDARRSTRRSDVIIGRMTIEGAPYLRAGALSGVRLRESLRQERPALPRADVPRADDGRRAAVLSAARSRRR